MRHRWSIAAVLLAGAAVAPATATAQWTPSEGVTSTLANGRFPDVAVNSRGDAVAAWITTRASSRSAIKASVRPAGGDWERPQTLSRGGRSSRDPQVAINDTGEIVAAWRRVARTRRVNTGSGLKAQAVYVVQARRRTVGGSWGPTSDLSSSRQKSGAPRAGIDGKGRAVVVWHWGTGTAPGSPGFVSRVQGSVGQPNGRFAGGQRLSRRGGCGQAVGLPDVAVGDAGDAIAWWECRRNLRNVSLDYSMLARDTSRFGSNRRLPDVSRGGPDVAATVAVDGSVLLSMTRNDGNARGPLVLTAARNGATGGLARPQSLRGARGSGVAVAGTRAGDTVATWAGPVSPSNRLVPVRAASRGSAARHFGPTERLQAPRPIGDIRATLAGNGSSMVAWVQGTGRSQRVMTAVRSDEARPWARPFGISAQGRIDPQQALAIAGDGTGNVVAYWSRQVGDRFRIERADYRAPQSASRR